MFVFFFLFSFLALSDVTEGLDLQFKPSICQGQSIQKALVSDCNYHSSSSLEIKQVKVRVTAVFFLFQSYNL